MSVARPIGGIEIIRDPSRTFADEYGVRDLILTPSETRKVRAIAKALDIPIGHAPTGRTVQLILMHCEALALRRSSEATDARQREMWYSVHLRARNAMGRSVN